MVEPRRQEEMAMFNIGNERGWFDENKKPPPVVHEMDAVTQWSRDVDRTPVACPSRLLPSVV